MDRRRKYVKRTKKGKREKVKKSKEVNGHGRKKRQERGYRNPT